MAKKVTHISINKLESTMQNNVVTVPMNGHPEIEIVIRRVLPLQDVLQFVEDVVSSCLDMDSGRYIPEIKAFVIRSSVLTRYANFTLPKDPEKQYDIIYNTDAFENVMGHINRTQYDEIMNAIDERIAHEVFLLENTVAGQTAALTAKIDSFVSDIEEIFGSVDKSDMPALVKNLSNIGNVDEGKLARAVFDARKESENGSVEDPVVSTSGNVVTLRKKKD